MEEVKVIEDQIEVGVDGDSFTDKIQEILDLIRKRYKKDSKAVHSIFINSIDFSGGKIKVKYRAEIYNHDFDVDNIFWNSYKQRLR